jgi:exosortase
VRTSIGGAAMPRATPMLAAGALDAINIPVAREGNILELPNQKRSVVEACSAIRPLRSRTFLSLVYLYFFEKKAWVRVVLFLATFPSPSWPTRAG